MNNEPATQAAPSPALDIQARAAEFLIARRDHKMWAEKDEEAFQAWLSESMAHRIAFWRLESVWARADRLNALRPLQQLGHPIDPRPQRKTTLIAMAAAVLVGVIGIGASTGLWLSQTRVAAYATPVGGREIIRLADGSSIELNTNTAIQTAFTAQRRVVELIRCEALFKVKHDAARPFVLLAANHRVIDLGTQFLAREDGARLKVVVIEGSARLESKAGEGNEGKSAILTPGDEAVATARDMLITRRSVRQLDNELGWRRGVLIFQHATLVDVAKEYNRYNNRKIVVADAKARSRVISVTLPTNDVAGFARMARNFLGLHVEENDSEIVISR
jgi:transmembrane sensor